MPGVAPDTPPDELLEFRAVRASGPGGQNVNKVSNAIELRFDSARWDALPAGARARLRRIAGRRMTAEGVIVIDAQRLRSLEQNRADDTFGWGVVFSDETLGNFETADPQTYAEICASFERWTDIDTFVGGAKVTSTGHGFCGLARKRLLNILQKRCEGLGVRIVYERAFGGFASPENPVGCGTHARPDGSVPQPNFARASTSNTTAVTAAVGPAGFGPIASRWAARASLRGSLPASGASRGACCSRSNRPCRCGRRRRSRPSRTSWQRRQLRSRRERLQP